MKRVFLDTNIIIDLVARPDYSNTVKRLLTEGKTRKCKFSISFLTLANYSYIDRKEAKERLYANLKMLCSVFEVLPNEKHQITSAITLNTKDFEDAIQYSTALSGKCESIVTRNKKDFIEFSILPVYTPEEFLEIIQTS